MTNYTERAARLEYAKTRLANAVHGSVSMTAPPSVAAPRAGDRITATGGEAYVKRASAVSQAAAWNQELSADPVCGPASGFVVGVGPRMDGRYPLVWIATGSTEGQGATCVL